MKRTSDITILGTVVYGVSISTTTFTLRSCTSLGSTQMNNQSNASKSDLPRSLEMKKIFNGCLLHGCVRKTFTNFTWKKSAALHWVSTDKCGVHWLAGRHYYTTLLYIQYWFRQMLVQTWELPKVLRSMGRLGLKLILSILRTLSDHAGA